MNINGITNSPVVVRQITSLPTSESGQRGMCNVPYVPVTAPPGEAARQAFYEYQEKPWLNEPDNEWGEFFM